MRLKITPKPSLIPHVFLPLRLPGNSLNIVSEESLLLSLFNETIQSFDSKSQEEDDFKNTRTTFRIWDSLQENLDPKLVSQSIKALNEGETFALYIRAQNVGLIITVPRKDQDRIFNAEEDVAAFSTFPASQPSLQVTSSVRDLAGVFPVTSVIVPRNFLDSLCFARQLNALNVTEISEAMGTVIKATNTITEVREVADPYYVSKWLTAVLCDESSKSSSSEVVPRVIKKVRDNVVFDEAKIPFRRSGLWMTAKVVLQICLTQDLGKIEGYFLYKMILIKFMLLFVKLPDQSSGIMLEMMGKISRRSRKLQLFRENNQVQAWLDESFNLLMNESATILKDANKNLKTKWEDVIQKETDLSEFNIRDIDVYCEHKLKRSNIDRLLIKLQKNERIFNLMKMVISVPPAAPRHREFHSKFDHYNFETADEHMGIVLYDFERNVRSWENIITEVDTVYVWGVFKTYLEKGKVFYVDDPIGASRMVLTLLKIIQVWDRVATTRYPMLLDHRPGVNLEFAGDLLLPNRSEMYALHQIEAYFAERERRALLPSLIEEPEVTTSSFAHRFARENKTMQRLRLHILDCSEKHKEKKIIQVHDARETCEKLRSRIKSLECEYIVDHWKRKHSPACTRCRLDSEERKCTVQVFEAPIPVAEEAQNAVVFELTIPSQIAVLRDLLFLFSSRIIVNTPIMIGEDLYGPWTNYRPIANCNTREQKWIVDLKSTKKLVLQSHYKDLHPSNPDSDFIRCNGYNCMYSGEERILGTNPNRSVLKNACTLKVQKKSPYSAMQWAIDGHKYTPNEVLARQSECHNDLSLLEFIEFGSLRTGWKIQWRNIYRAFTQLTLSLKNESVFNLLCQTIWQAGPCDFNVGNSFRVAHQDFEDWEFAWEFLYLLEDIHRKHVDNWKDNYVLLSCIIISQRIITLTNSSSVQEAASKILTKCRTVATHWSDEIQRIVSQLTNAPRPEVDALRIKIVEVNVCCALTFHCSAGIIKAGSIEPEKIQYWLLSIAKIHDNLVLIGQGYKIPTNLKNLLRRIEEAGVFLEPYLKDDFQTGILSDGLNLFVDLHYPSSQIMQHLPIWKSHDETQQIYFCEIYPKEQFGERTVLQMDVIRGRFLVDGSPVGYLPTKIENHPDFHRTFPTKSFEVQPYAFQPGRMISRDKYLGSAYSFYLKEDGSLLVTEHFEEDLEDSRRELINYNFFKDNVPPMLVKNYTHWWNFKAQRFEFFHRDLNSPSKLFTVKPDYFLDVKNQLLKDFRCLRRSMVDINTKGYVKILKIMERLENWKFINIWFERGENNSFYVIDLPRMGLQFTFTNPRGTISLTSKEYRGMKVSRIQNIKTLIGLQNGLLIEDAGVQMSAKKNSIFLVPHGTVGIDYVNNRTVINTAEELRTPIFFAYEVDTQLKQLKAGESQAGWVYLAYLHAATSSPLPDPFTGVTGTERALQILQSGHCWSCEPMEEETVLTLRNISELTPNRQYYPRGLKKMETVKWTLAPQVAHDAFQLVVEKLLWDSEKLRFLFSKSEEEEGPSCPDEESFNFKSDRELCIRGYYKRLKLSTENSRISPDFLEEFSKIPLCLPINQFDTDFKSSTMKNVLRLSQMCKNWTCNPPLPTAGLVKKLLFSGSDLKGKYDEGFPIKEAVDSWWKTNFREHWLDLYVLARKVQRKKLEAEWAHLLTFLAFQEAIDINQLLLLQTVAVYAEEFKCIDPPNFTEYYQTDEFEFNYQTILMILTEQCATKWTDYMDKHCEEQLLEDSLESFVDRLRPIHEELVATQTAIIADKIRMKWPLDSCEDIIDELKDDEKSEIDCEMTKIQLNVFLKNWYRNRELYIFVNQVETIVGSLEARSKSHAHFIDISKNIFRVHQKGNLDKFCEKELFTINLHDLLAKRAQNFIDEKLYEEAKGIFCRSTKTPTRKSIENASAGKKVPEFPLLLQDACPILQEYSQDLQESWQIYHQNSISSNYVVEYEPQRSNKLTMEHKFTRQRALFFWERLRNAIHPHEAHMKDNVIRQLFFAELMTHVVPLNLLPIIKKEKPKEPFLTYLWTLVGAYGVLVTYEQKAARCVRYSQRGKNFQGFELQKELSHQGHENWDPAERRDWLLFEIEMDLMVRPIQAQVAERMENPENNENALIQLNMGEGKTSVIVPLLVLSLANGKRLCRVTVLKSLYRINHAALISRIGGLLLNRRVYTFPCRRDKKIRCEDAEWMLTVYKECAAMRGVVLTLPEYRLSFELKAYEKCQANCFNDGRAVFHVQEWLKNNARDVLDESDEILHVKYQLIYTLGKQMPIEGGALRWNVCSGLLALVPENIEGLLKIHGTNYVEYNTRSQPFKFPYCRILKAECYSVLCERLANSILNGDSKIQIPEIKGDRKPILVKFLTKEAIDRSTFNEIYKWYPIQAHQEVLLILRGFLACGVLCTALSKRWRVNYGVNPVGYRRMAVPFRAKDVAAERTEFGHPDIAIVLTELSYYYSGLSDEQLAHCFVILFLEPNPSQVYETWIDRIPSTFPGYETIRHLSSVNLKDFTQKTKVLFPALRKNIATIDFWLGHVVFPQESKQFGYKIGCSPWDLCLDKNNRRHPTTGFSGTNDSKILLPKTIIQKDLKILQGTNGEVLKNLLLEENNQYEALPLGFTGRQILEKLVDEHIKLLLDVGALMLELNNEQVAKQWLKMENDAVVDAAVYFDEYNKLVVIDRSGNPPVSLEISTFRTRLDRCVIYLDDVHTRGTDLKIPPDTRGCVTLGKGVTKDKLVQGCMRMRMLGQRPGHQVIFWASQEVHNAIQGLVNITSFKYDRISRIETKHVLQWSIMNNRDAIKDGFIHWASAGVYQAQKLSAQVLYNSSSRKDPDLFLLAESCAQKEQVDLKNMYGDVRSLEKFPTIVQHLLNRVNRELKKRLDRSRSNTSLMKDIAGIVEFFGSSVREHSQKYVADVLRSTQLLDEEQERELEHELEAQHQKQKPGKAKSQEHGTSVGVQRFILTGHLQDIDQWAVQIPLALKATTLWSFCPNDTWAPTTYASRDFATVIRSSASKSDKTDFLRPPNWLCSVSYSDDEKRRKGKTVVLLLSPWEVEFYMDFFRTGTTKAILHMFAPRLSLDQDTLCKNQALAIPSMKFSETFPSAVNSALLLFSGSTYFLDKMEQDEYCRFAGFCPRPRTKEEDEVFEQGGLCDGFVAHEFRDRLGYALCAFAKNPEQLIRKIVERRYGTFSMDSHVGKIVFQCKKPYP